MQNDLDLTTIESSDIDALTQKIENFYKQDSAQKASLSYNWQRNHMMLDGQQWIVFKGNRDTGGLWERLESKPENEYIPRPVTNYLFDAYQTLKGYLLKNDPRITVRPNTRTNRDKTAAKIAELVSGCNWERLHEAENYEYAASCGLTYGTVFKKDFWDNSYMSLAKVPRMVQQPVIDPNTGMPTGQMDEVHETDPNTGEKLFDELPLGDVQTAVVEPYRIALDPLAANLHEARWIMEYSIRPLNWIAENYDKPQEQVEPQFDENGEPQPPQQQQGYTGRSKEVKAEKALSNSLRKFFNLKTSSGTKNIDSLGGSGGDSEMVEEAAVVKEYYERPTQKHPKGRLIVVANNIPLYADNSPYEGPEQGDWHPYSDFRWELLPGRFWGKGPLDEACEPQKHINSIDSITILTRKTMAVPQKLEPKNSVVKGNQWDGMPGRRVQYNPGPNGEKPETIPAMGVHEQVFQERAQKVEDIKNISGAIDILKGDRPPGVTAHSALSLLFEVGTGKLHPIMKRWKKFIETSQKKQLRLVAKKYREPRPDFIRMLMSKNQDLTEDQIKNFVGEDLYDNCNVIIEASSAIPRLQAAEDAKLMELAQMGVLNLENPSNRAEFLDRFGIVGFDSDYSKDAERASWENDLLDNIQYSPDNKPIVLECDNHEIHIAVIEDRMKEPSFLDLSKEVIDAYYAHKTEHEQMLNQQKEMQQMEAMMMGQPPPEQQPNPMDAKENIRKGPGITNKTKEAMQPDLLGPRTGVAG